MHPSKQRVLDIYGHEPKDLDDLARCTISVINRSSFLYNKRTNIRSRVVGFSWDITYSNKIDNNHSCPLSGEKNFGGYKPNIPTHYPGWYGRVWIRYSNTIEYFGSDPFSESLTYPGSGGSGSYDGPWKNSCRQGYEKNRGLPAYPHVFSWDYKIFMDDWPLINYEMESLLLLDMLEHDRILPNSHAHKFLWEEEESERAEEREYLQNLNDKWDDFD